MERLRIGLDLDNTLVRYDQVFIELARSSGLIGSDFSGGKKALRDELRLAADGEKNWMRLQGRVYGAHMADAEMFEGVDPFLRHCRETGTDVFIVSHKTEYGHYDPDRTNLREAALNWMKNKGFFSADGYEIDPDQVFFCDTREAKCRQIGSLDLDLFIDDLVEVFLEPDFPLTVEQHLFHPGSGDVPQGTYQVHKTWEEIDHAVFT